MAQYVYDHPDIIRDRVVLELGAGIHIAVILLSDQRLNLIYSAQLFNGYCL